MWLLLEYELRDSHSGTNRHPTDVSQSWHEGQRGDDRTATLKSQARVLDQRVRSVRRRVTWRLVKPLSTHGLPMEAICGSQPLQTNLLRPYKGGQRILDIVWRVTFCVHPSRGHQPSGFQKYAHERGLIAPHKGFGEWANLLVHILMFSVRLSSRKGVAMHWTAHRKSVKIAVGWLMGRVLQKQIPSKRAITPATIEECA